MQRPRWTWWLFAVVLFLICVLLQVPAAWVVNRLMPQASWLEAVDGNIWHGQASMQLPVAAQALPLGVQWQYSPRSLLGFKLGSQLALTSGSSDLKGQVAAGKSSWQLRGLSGRLATETIAPLLAWQWPAAPIQLSNIELERSKSDGFTQAGGQLNWAGGRLGYPFEGRVEYANLPPLVGRLSMDQGRMHLALTNAANERMGDIYISKDNYLTVQLTQRLLSTVEGYHGQAGLDTAVVSTRQPLSALGL